MNFLMLDERLLACSLIMQAALIIVVAGLYHEVRQLVKRLHRDIDTYQQANLESKSGGQQC